MSCLTILGVEMQAVEMDAQRHQHTQRDALETMSHILCYAQQCGLIITPISHKHKTIKKGKGSPYSITERRVPELIPVLGSQPAGDVSHKPGGRLPILSARPAVTTTTLKRAATNFAAW